MTDTQVPSRSLVTACAVALVVVVVAACNRGSDGSGNTAGSDMDKRRAYAQCMRDNGVSNFSDPNPNGQYGVGHEINRDDPKFTAANEKCRELLPAGDRHDVVGPETIQNLVKFARCMRENGVPEFPDPGADGKFPRSAEEGAHDAPQFQAASDKCQQDLPQHGGG